VIIPVFRTLPTVDRIHHDADLPASAAGYARDTITLGWEDRVKTRGRRQADEGVEFGVAFPHGTILRAGDLLIVEPHRLIVAVVERSELVFVVTPHTPAEWGLFAYHVGNGHHPVMITEHELVCPNVPGVESLLQYHRIPYERGLRAFTPVASLSSDE
jgi:urease accessory protein